MVDYLQPVGDRHFESYEIARPIGKIRLSFDQAEFEADGSRLVIQRFRTGRLTKSEANNSIYGLLHKAAAELGGNAGSEVQVRYLGHDVTMEVPLSAKQIETRLGHYDDAISGIASGIFDPTPADHECHRCPHYFICPAAESSE